MTSRSSQPSRVPADVIAWRRELLRHAGCERDLAGRLAADGEIDLHGLLNLIDRGCPPQLAARILAPLDRPEPAG
jgi:hypothetical protein